MPSVPNHFANHDRLRRELREFATSDRTAELKVAVLTGPSGIGKTALALRTAADLAPALRLHADLGVDPQAPGAASETLRRFLLELGMSADAVPDRLAARSAAFRALTRNRRVLVIIDGAGTAAQVRALLPDLGLVLVTEARPLSLDARFFALPPLTPDTARTLLAETEPEIVDKVIELAAGLPLALRVADALLARADRPTFAADIFTTAYRSLGEPAQRCYRALALPGTTADIGIDALAVALPTTDVRAAMTDLVAARLADEPTTNRFRTSDVVRQHARTIAPPDPGAITRLREHYLTRCAAAYRASNRWPQTEPWFTCPPGTEPVDLAWFDTERDNIRAALEHAFATGERDLVATWCVLLWPYYEHGKHTADLLATHELGSQTANPALRALLLARTGFAHLFTGDTDQAIVACTEAVALATTIDPRLAATALEALGLAHLAAANPAQARQALRRNLDLARRTGEPRRIALACLHNAKVEPPELALPLLDEAAPHFANDPVNLTKTRLWRGRALTEHGDLAAARETLDLALAEFTSLHRPFDRAEALAARGHLNTIEGHLDQARADYAQARAVFEEWGFSQRAAALPG